MSRLIKRGDIVYNARWIGVVTQGQKRSGTQCLVLWWNHNTNEPQNAIQRDETCLTVLGRIEDFGVDPHGAW